MCTYAACAIRLQGSDVLSGQEGRKITSYGFLAGPQLRPWMAVSDSAERYVTIVEDNYVSGTALSLAGSLLLIGGALAVQGLDDRGQQQVAFAVSIGGLVVLGSGTSRLGRAQNAMNSAVWWYNASLSSPAAGDGQRLSPPVPIRGTHARAGTALGSLVGVVGGLAATSGLDHTQTAEGVSITLAIAALGGLIGHQIGERIER